VAVVVAVVVVAIVGICFCGLRIDHLLVWPSYFCLPYLMQKMKEKKKKKKKEEKFCFEQSDCYE
jgi:hypothetical protein